MSEQAVAQHYSQGELERRIVDAFTTMGADPEHLDSDQLAPVDEFHIGGRRATVELVGQLDLRPGLRVLDVAGLLVQTERDRRIFGIDFFREMQVRIARDGLPALGLHIVMGPGAALKIANLVDNMERAVVAPTEMVCAELSTTSLPHSSRVRQ